VGSSYWLVFEPLYLPPGSAVGSWAEAASRLPYALGAPLGMKMHGRAAGPATQHSFLICLSARQNQRNHAPLISSPSDEDSKYFAIIRRRLTWNDALPHLKTVGIANVFLCLVFEFDELEMSRIRIESFVRILVVF
jgi:hypothetical protein